MSGSVPQSDAAVNQSLKIDKPIPYWRLSGFYFVYFAQLGVFLPYWGLYLSDRGFTAVAIGQLMAITMAVRIVGPNLWGWLADRYRKRLPIVRLGAVLAVMFFTGILWHPGFALLALALGLFSFFWNAILPQVEVMTIQHLAEQANRYGRIRLWGSIGFIIAVVGSGALFDRIPVTYVPHVMFGVILSIVLICFTLYERKDDSEQEHSDGLWAILKRPEVFSFIFVCFLMQLSHGPLYFFYSIYLEDFGYSKSTIGWLWSLGVMAEIVLFLLMPRLMQRFSIKQLLAWCFILAGVRWVLIGYCVDSLWILHAAQLFHAASFGVFHAVSIHLVHVFFGERHAGQGQSLYSSMCYGAGSAAGAMLSGYAWDYLGGAQTFAAASLVCILAVAVIGIGMSRLDQLEDRK